MKAACLLGYLTLVLAQAAAQEPMVRASLATKEAAWVGQRIVFVVELLAPGYFAGAPAFDLPDPPGLLLVPPEGHPTLGSEEIGGVTYTVQRHEIALFTRRAGQVTVPPIAVRFQFKRQPLDKESIPATVKTAPFELVTQAPPGAEKLGGIISARSLTAVESWKPQPGPAKAGGAFTRTIVFKAPDVPAMAFPPFPAPKIDGLGIYRKPPVVRDHSERGALSGERQDTITYLCQRPGEFIIPATRLTWWDLDAQQLRTIDFPAQKLRVAPNPALSAPAAAPAPGDAPPSLASLAPAVGTLLALVFALALLMRPEKPWLAPFRPVHLAPLNPGEPEKAP